MRKQKFFKIWLEERDEVIKKYDVEEFKRFFRKWQIKGFYNPTMKLPPDHVIEISMRKMVYHMNSATLEEKKAAEEWLINHGSDTEI